MLTTVEDVVQRLVDGYDPDRIILYGSWARSEARPDSDVDLLIVKETDRRPADRRLEVERLLSDGAIPLDLVVYTPRRYVPCSPQATPSSRTSWSPGGCST